MKRNDPIDSTISRTKPSDRLRAFCCIVQIIQNFDNFSRRANEINRTDELCKNDNRTQNKYSPRTIDELFHQILIINFIRKTYNRRTTNSCVTWKWSLEYPAERSERRETIHCGVSLCLVLNLFTIAILLLLSACYSILSHLLTKHTNHWKRSLQNFFPLHKCLMLIFCSVSKLLTGFSFHNVQSLPPTKT